MARVGRLAGAILAETGGELYLVGNTKVPCDWSAAGVERPIDVDARERPFVRLARMQPAQIATPWLTLEIEGEALPALLAKLFLIERTASVSERLWALVTGEHEDAAPCADVVDARWLGEIPEPIWRIVRDTVLRCT